MSIFIQIYIFFFLHILFIIKYIINKKDALSHQYFGVSINFTYSYDTINKTIVFNLLCFSMLIIGLIIGNRMEKKIRYKNYNLANLPIISKSITFYLLCFNFILLIGIFLNGFNYWALNDYRISLNILFELRVIGLILLSYFILSRGRFSTIQKTLLSIYFVFLIIYQARSLVLDAVLSIALSYLFLQKDKLKIKFVALSFILLVVPNLFVIARYWPLPLDIILNNIFNFEYTLLFNLLVAEAIDSYEGKWLLGETIIPSMYLVIPSFIRELLGITVIKSSIYQDVSNDAGVFGGGFSLLSELFINLDWFGCLYFLIFGFFIAFCRSNIIRCLHSKKGSISFYQAGYCVFYSSSLLSLRNDAGVFFKYTIQLILIVFLLEFIRRVKK